MFLRLLLLTLAAAVALSGCGDSDHDTVAAPADEAEVPAAVATGRLNDTGIQLFADAASNSLATEPVDYPGQDAAYGRDAAAAAGTLVKTGGGVAGFDFTKLDAAGQPLADQGVDYATNPWACVRDNVTGLIWEVKTDDGGLRDKDWTYTWYNNDPTTNGGSAGTENGGTCVDTENCDTEKYAAAVNAAGLCGATDWRLPTVEELRSIVDYGVAAPGPTIDTDYFPNTRTFWFWSASSYAGSSDGAWGVYFAFGNDATYGKSVNNAVCLVRGGTVGDGTGDDD